MASTVSVTLSIPDAAAAGRRRSSCTCEPNAVRYISQRLRHFSNAKQHPVKCPGEPALAFSCNLDGQQQ